MIFTFPGVFLRGRKQQQGKSQGRADRVQQMHPACRCLLFLLHRAKRKIAISFSS